MKRGSDVWRNMVIVSGVEAQEVRALCICWEAGNTPNIKVYPKVWRVN